MMFDWIIENFEEKVKANDSQTKLWRSGDFSFKGIKFRPWCLATSKTLKILLHGGLGIVYSDYRISLHGNIGGRTVCSMSNVAAPPPAVIEDPLTVVAKERLLSSDGHLRIRFDLQFQVPRRQNKIWLKPCMQFC
jgi:hypothetical protein